MIINIDGVDTFCKQIIIKKLEKKKKFLIIETSNDSISIMKIKDGKDHLTLEPVASNTLKIK